MSLDPALMHRRLNRTIEADSYADLGDSPDSLTRMRVPRRSSSAEIDELVAGRLRGEEIASLAERFGVHRNTAMDHLARRGVPGRRWPGRTLSDADLVAAGQLYEGGVRLELVGEQFGVDRRYLRRVLPELVFQIRRSGQQKRSSA